jgi:hypothetical protein
MSDTAAAAAIEWEGIRDAFVGDEAAEAALAGRPGLTVTNVDWAIEVVLATEGMHNPAANGVPVVNLTLELSDGSRVQRRLTGAELHKWRHTLARATKDLHVIASRQPVASAKGRSKYAS